MDINTTSAVSQRIKVLDLIRGIAVLGILVMNIQSFTMPISAYSNPTSFGDLSGANYGIWLGSHLLFDMKFMTLFSVLFGVGIAIFSERVTLKEGYSGKRHYVRMFWLLVIGLLHAYLIWWGDILTLYAVSGCIAYLFLQSPARTLLITGLGLVSCMFVIMMGTGAILPHLPEEDVIKDIMPLWQPGAEAIKAEIAALNGSWSELHAQRIEHALVLQSNLVLYGFRIVGLMLIGMALYKSGFIKQVYSTRTYLLVAMVSLALGYWLTWEGVLFNEHHEFSWKYSLAWGTQFNYWGSLLVALGYLSLILVWGKNIDGSLIKRSLSSVGKMAFTNYLMQSIICASLLWGTGFALFGQLDRVEQLLWVLGIWVVCIGFSVAWLKRFEYGPAEWVWRCLTYGRLFPLIRQDK